MSMDEIKITKMKNEKIERQLDIYQLKVDTWPKMTLMTFNLKKADLENRKLIATTTIQIRGKSEKLKKENSRFIDAKNQLQILKEKLEHVDSQIKKLTKELNQNSDIIRLSAVSLITRKIFGEMPLFSRMTASKVLIFTERWGN